MKSLLFTLVAVSFLSAPALALSPEAADFVRKAGLDPASATVKAADADGTIVTIFHDDEKQFSLESLAIEKAKNGVNAFVFTRTFIRKLKANYAGTPFPTSSYDGLYLTLDERKLAMRKMVE